MCHISAKSSDGSHGTRESTATTHVRGITQPAAPKFHFNVRFELIHHSTNSSGSSSGGSSSKQRFSRESATHSHSDPCTENYKSGLKQLRTTENNECVGRSAVSSAPYVCARTHVRFGWDMRRRTKNFTNESRFKKILDALNHSITQLERSQPFLPCFSLRTRKFFEVSSLVGMH